MSATQIEKISRLTVWISKLPIGEPNTPIVTIDGRDFTPNNILKCLRKGLPCGDIGFEELFGPNLKVTPELLYKRLETKALQNRLPTLYRLTAEPGASVVTASNRLAQVRAGSLAGQEELEAERLYLLHMLQR